MHRPLTAGVTLIELLVTLAIIAILALIAYPSYQGQVSRTWRMKAVGCLEELTQGMERRFNGKMSYIGTAPPPNGCVVNGDPDWVVPDEALASRYAFGFVAEPTATTFTLFANPIGQQATSDATCGRLTITEAGLRASADATDGARCW